MVKSVELALKEKSFLDSMMDLGEVKFSGSEVCAEEYRKKYSCDPCEACGPEACADCKGCVEGDMTQQTNPFSRNYLSN